MAPLGEADRRIGQADARRKAEIYAKANGVTLGAPGELIIP